MKKNATTSLIFGLIITIFMIFVSVSCEPPTPTTPPDPTTAPEPTEEPPVVTEEPPVITDAPTAAPTEAPTDAPAITAAPTAAPTIAAPTIAPPTAAPSTAPTPEPVEGAGEVWIVPAEQVVSVGLTFNADIHINSGTQKIAAYGIVVTYDSNIIGLGPSGVDEGADGYTSAVNTNTPGIIQISGFDATGVGPSGDLEMVIIEWTGIAEGTSAIDMTIDKLVDDSTTQVGTPTAISGSVTVAIF